MPHLDNHLTTKSDPLSVKVQENKNEIVVKIGHPRLDNRSLVWPFEEVKNGKSLPLIKFLKDVNVDCNQLVVLDISHSKLKDLPENFDLNGLKCLNLSNNLFEDVPYCIRRGCRSLQNLDLSNNLIKRFDNEPKCSKKLISLKLSNNLLMNIPPWILLVKAFNLEELYYSTNKITDLQSSRYRCTSMHTLKTLQLVDCYLQEEDLNFVKSIYSLERLDLSNRNGNESLNDLNCNLLLDKPDWSYRIKVLHLNNLGISVLPDTISRLILLQELHLTKNLLSWLPDSIVNLKYLRVLNVERNNICHLPWDLNKLTSLEVIKMANNEISCIPDLSGLRNLQYLDFYNNYIEECSMCLIRMVKCIDLEQNYVITEKFAPFLCYSEKRNAIRLVETERVNGSKCLEPEWKSCYSGGECSEDDEFSDRKSDNKSIVSNRTEDIEERWDMPETLDGYMTDDDWLGFEKTQTKFAVRKRNLVEDFSEVCFEDVPE